MTENTEHGPAREIFDPLDSSLRVDPYPHYARLRATAPVYYSESAKAWLVSTYKEALYVLEHPAEFSSQAMRALMVGSIGRDGEQATAELFRLLTQLPPRTMQMMAARSLIMTDPPHHGPMRMIVSKLFTPRRIAALEPLIRSLSERLVRDIPTNEEFDLVASLSMPLPVTVIATLLGVDPTRMEDFKRWSDTLMNSSTGSGVGTRQAAMLEAMTELADYFLPIIEGRRANHQEDLISALVRGEGDDGALTPVEVLMFAILLLVAGNETTTNLIGNTVNVLLSHPDELQKVLLDRGRLPDVLEEVLRFDSPVQCVMRSATRDLELGGQRIAAGEVVMPLLGAANRDAIAFANSETFLPGRAPGPHLAFGHGAHFCLGASLARLEARVALEVFLGRPGRLGRGRTDLTLVDSFLVRGPARFPLAFVLDQP